jgi:hypothetical protein
MQNPSAGRWKPKLCATCPVPDILRQNACPNLVLEGKVHKSILGLVERVQIYAVCMLKLTEVTSPAVGCGDCHLHSPGAQILK